MVTEETVTAGVKRCYRCDALLDAVSTERVVGVHRTDNHFIEVCVNCANYLVAATTHRRVPPYTLPDAKL